MTLITVNNYRLGRVSLPLWAGGFMNVGQHTRTVPETVKPRTEYNATEIAEAETRFGLDKHSRFGLSLGLSSFMCTADIPDALLCQLHIRLLKFASLYNTRVSTCSSSSEKTTHTVICFDIPTSLLICPLSLKSCGIEWSLVHKRGYNIPRLYLGVIFRRVEAKKLCCS